MIDSERKIMEYNIEDKDINYLEEHIDEYETYSDVDKCFESILKRRKNL